ncbi:Telomere length regulator protein rif1 [Madurella mycetomatis]|uniref:Telomere length regulator protein rif1 n=1 Tax=Madurella mycetomatis TaxID=100816 RepID=A0A175WHP3_9PEZI|nr:Telomere length regulator protein rif1 [Madurella mycetomatis]
MSSPAILSSVLSSLPPRPPTPPREAHHEASAPINRQALGPIDTRLSLHTPPGFQSPASSLTTNSTSRRTRKKVGFSAQAEYKDPPVYAEGEQAKQNLTPVSLSRSASKPVKSILKVPTPVPNLLDSINGAASEPSDPSASLATMLESTIQQLAGGDRDSKVDAYLMLTRAWKASNNLPDRVALQEKMSLFTQFMQRDVVAKTPEGTLDTSLVSHTLNLLNTFLHFPAIASTISNDFGVFIIDHCIRSFEDPSTTKDIARRLMQVISLQNFSPKVMTADRVGRLVSSLHNIEENLKGKSIVLSRVFIYRKLVKQSRQLMVIHSDWLLDMFTDMLSNLADIRSSAISLGLEAAFSVGHEKQLSRRVMEVFNLSFEDMRYIQYYEEKLKAMTKDKHESAVVPEIWSVVILLLRVPLDKWEYAGPWLHIIQNCFNSADFPTKIAANRAWGRLVYLIHLDERSFAKNLSTLTTPLISQLRRKGSGKTSEDLRQAVLGGICNLFYYTFKPTISSKLLDAYWDNTVKPVVVKMLDPKVEAAEDNLCQASVILGGLFNCTTPRRWRIDRIVDTPLAKPEELPAIDPKWIRHNASRVLAVVGPILEQDFTALAGTSTPAYNLWQALVSTVASAAAKEIKVSRDTALFVAEALNVLQKIWKQGLQNEEGGSEVVDFLLAARAYLEVMISSLGLLPFTEKTGKHQGTAKTPLYSLFSMLSTLPPGVRDDKDFADFFGAVFAPFFASKGDRAKMDLAHDLLSTIPMDTQRPYGPWLLVAENIQGWLEPSDNSHHSAGSGYETPVGHNYRDIVKVLERGIRSTPNLPRKEWESLFYALFERVREETGDAGVAILVVEPLAKVLLEQFAPQTLVDTRPNCVQYVTELVSVATQPRDRQAVDAARKRLWGTVLAGSRSSSFDTFDNLYRAVSEALNHSYSGFDPADSDSAVHLLNELSGFFDRCNRQLFPRAMVAVQDGFLPWFQDSKRLLGGQANSILAAVKSLWDRLSRLITEIDHPEQQLQSLEQFFCASFASCHRSVVNCGVSLWNSLFENMERLDYPEQLKTALVQMQLHADIILPGLEASSSEHAGQQPLFVDSFDDFSLPKYPSTRSSSRRGTPRPALSPTPLNPAIPSKRHQHTSLPIASSRPTRTTRLKHDDSQVQFAAIEPSLSIDSPLESQMLTERQKEVRERQRENAALFSDIQSSPRPKSMESDRYLRNRQSPCLGNPGTRQAATPEPEERFNDYVSSTPTPRRGQLVVMSDHDMTDPPSSPPELRGNPLAAEIRSRSASHSLLEEWQFSSSPISGSPNPNRHGTVADPSSQRCYGTVEPLPGAPKLPSHRISGNSEAEPQSATDEVIEDSFSIVYRMDTAPAPEPSGSPVGEGPSTPQLSSKPPVQAQETPTPKSDREIFVDAPTSPLPPTPKRSGRSTEAAQFPEPRPAQVVVAESTSFDISDVDERSLLRLVVELDSGKVDPLQYHQSSASPDGKGRASPPSLDCIVVMDSPTKTGDRVISRKTRANSAPSVVSSADELENPPSSQLKPLGRPKRKRAASKAHEASGQKRQRPDSIEPAGEVPASQMALAQATKQAPTTGAENSKEEGPEEWIPSSSVESSSLEVPSPRERVGSQDSAVSEAGEAMEVEGSEQEVQSQIARESYDYSRRQGVDDGKAAAAENSPAVEEMQVDAHQAITNTEQDSRPAKLTVEAEEGSKDEPNQLLKIMDLFRSGLDELRSARLSRPEVYQIEDMFMDMKRELYEAERRGRT